jgi:hypothetical protein
VEVSVHPPVDAPHKPQICIPEERVAGAVCAGALHANYTDKAVEIGDRARLAPLSRHHRGNGSWEIQVHVGPAEGIGNQDSAGDGQGADYTWDAAILQGLNCQTVMRSAASLSLAVKKPTEKERHYESP